MKKGIFRFISMYKYKIIEFEKIALCVVKSTRMLVQTKLEFSFENERVNLSNMILQNLSGKLHTDKSDFFSQALYDFMNKAPNIFEQKKAVR